MTYVDVLIGIKKDKMNIETDSGGWWRMVKDGGGWWRMVEDSG